MAVLVIPLGPGDIQTDMVPKPNDTLSPGDRASVFLPQNNALYSPTGAFRLFFGVDGVARVQVITDNQLPNLVWTDIWTSNTFDKGGEQLAMQIDGNLVIYSGSGPIFSTLNPKGFDLPSPYLRMQDDGNLVIYDGNGVPYWSTGTNARV
jgi:hypothetical protein